MIISTPLLNHMAIGATKVVPEVGDSTPAIQPIVVLTTETLLQTLVVGSTPNVETDQSVITSAATNVPASTGAGNVTAMTLKKGMYVLDVLVAARFVGTPAATGNPDVFVDIVDEAVTTAVRIVALYAQTLQAQVVQRRVRLSLPGTYLVRRQTAATGVGQTMEISWHLAAERQL